MDYKKSLKIFIKETYINIFKKSRKVVIMLFDMIFITKSERRFQILL